MTQLLVNGHIIEANEDVTYNFQASSIADMSLSKSNYTSSFNIPKTIENIRFFEGLGLTADTSRFPYIINNCDCMDNYVTIYSGVLVIMKTTEQYYQATVISGTFDLFSLVGDKTFADIPAVSSLIPVKSPSVVSSYIQYSTNRDVAFILANYGGVTHVIKNSELLINVDCLAISFRAQFLWSQIFDFLGLSYQLYGVNLSELEDQYITFPYPPYPEVVDLGALSFEGTIRPYIGALDEGNTVPSAWKSWQYWESIDLYLSGFNIICGTAGSYVINIPNFIAEEGSFTGTTILFDCVIYRNGGEIARFRTSRVGDPVTDAIYKGVHTFNAGDTITFDLKRLDGRTTTGLFSVGANVISFYRPELTDETRKQILNIKLKDFIKEFMLKYALIGFYENGLYSFSTINYTINNSDPINWSGKYIKRTDELYDIGYNQHNWLRHSYVQEGGDYFDRDIESNNMNLPFSKDIAKSTIFAPSNTSSPFYLGGDPVNSNYVSLRFFLIYSADNNSKVKTESRNFWIKSESFFANNVYLGSQTMNDRVQLSNVNISIANYTSGFSQNNNWTPLNQLLYNTRVHTIELNLNEIDVSIIDLKKPFYFEQESNYYMLSKLQYKKGEVAKAEFIRILKNF